MRSRRFPECRRDGNCFLGLEAPGDCAFVGIYGDQDDFALVLMEDTNGESISLTEGLPSEKHFKAPILFSE